MTQFEPYSTQDLAHLTTLLEGFASSAGAGSESLIQSTRPALLDVLETLPLIERTSASLLSTGNALLELYKIHISNDRVLIPLLELSGFLLDANLLQCLSQTKFKWRSFLSLIQKSHFKSTNISKLIAALHVYRGLAEVQAVRVDVLLKLANMLLHPFPKVSKQLQLFANRVKLQRHDLELTTGMTDSCRDRRNPFRADSRRAPEGT